MYTSKEVYEYISKQTNDPIIERKVCAISWTQFPILQSDLDFYSKISPTFNWVKFQVTTPTLCPEERQRRRLLFRNERKLYRRNCNASNRSIISIYSPDKPYKVYDAKIRWSDSWDPMDYGRIFDFSKTFTENFWSLLLDVPALGLWVFTSINCEFNNQIFESENCYMTSSCGWSKNAMYWRNIRRSEFVMDCIQVYDSQYIYQSDIVYNSQYIFYSQNIVNGFQCYSCKNCENCSFCYWCTDLQNKQYYRDNKQISKEEFETKIKHVFYNATAHNLIKKWNEGFVTSNIIYNSKDITLSYNIKNCISDKYCTEIEWANNCFDSEYASLWCELNLECTSLATNSVSCAFCYNVGNCYQCLYSMLCMNCEHCFWCYGLQKKSYCIFNKQYGKEEYEKIVWTIIEHMTHTWERGEFFNPSLSPFGYNETVAQEYYPLDQVGTQFFASALWSWNTGLDYLRTYEDTSLHTVDYAQFGYKRQEHNYDPKIPDGVQILTWDQVPVDVSIVDESICSKVIKCEISWRPFMIQKAELEFYKKMNLSLPRKHPDIRHEERMKLRPGRTLYLRSCDKCSKEMVSVYASDRRGGYHPSEHDTKIYCESCYRHEAFW